MSLSVTRTPPGKVTHRSFSPTLAATGARRTRGRTVAKKLPPISLKGFLACSGATTAALTNSYKGQTAQLYAMKALNPALVTITIGGDDIGFSKILRNCYLIHLPHDNCLTDGTLAQARANIVALGGVISGVYNAVKTEAPKATIVVVGYPQLFPNSQQQTTGCGWFDNNERSTLNSLAQLLDQELGAAATGVGVNYVSTLNVMAGHELCTRHSWINPIGRSPISSDGHPNAHGQAAMATAVEAKFQTLGL